MLRFLWQLHRAPEKIVLGSAEGWFKPLLPWVKRHMLEAVTFHLTYSVPGYVIGNGTSRSIFKSQGAHRSGMRSVCLQRLVSQCTSGEKPMDLPSLQSCLKLASVHCRIYCTMFGRFPAYLAFLNDPCCTHSAAMVKKLIAGSFINNNNLGYWSSRPQVSTFDLG